MSRYVADLFATAARAVRGRTFVPGTGGARSCCLALGLLAPAVFAADDTVHTRLVAAPPPASRVLRWADDPPPGCPFPPSADFAGLLFTGRHAEYTGADTWYPSWAADGHLYSPWTDGRVGDLSSGSGGRDATTGHAKIVGDDPLKLQVLDTGIYRSDPSPYAGRYPCGSLVHDGVWYYGTYCLHPSGKVPHNGIDYNWPWLGPFVGFRWSTDLGKTWTQTPCTPAQPLFGESALNGEPVKIGAPHFVDFGRDMEHAPGGQAHLVAHGASDGANRRFGFNSWITGDEIYLARVPPSIANMNDASKYEFFAGRDEGGADRWTARLADARPIAAWRDHMGCVTMTWIAPLKRYVMCVTDGGNTVAQYDTYLLESSSLTGPWKLLAYLRHFGEQSYFVNIPSKFVGADGRTLWLCYAANFSLGWNNVRWSARPKGSRYAMCLQEARLPRPGDDAPAPGPLETEDNVARQAKVTVSSVHADYRVEGVVDGTVDGFPRDIAREWATAGEGCTAVLRLTWEQEQTIDRVWLFDRPNDLDQVRSGVLLFSDGTTLRTGALPDDARQGLEIRFAARKVRWLVFAVDEVKPNSPNIGLAEIAVFLAGRGPKSEAARE